MNQKEFFVRSYPKSELAMLYLKNEPEGILRP